jgi:hypothetical protein
VGDAEAGLEPGEERLAVGCAPAEEDDVEVRLDGLGEEELLADRQRLGARRVKALLGEDAERNRVVVQEEIPVDAPRRRSSSRRRTWSQCGAATPSCGMGSLE